MEKGERFDAIVIGSGQGGTPLSGALAAAGLKTALVEERNVGGTCINYGCTPTKTMAASARVAHLLGRGRDYGAGGGPQSVDLARVRERKRAIVASFRAGSERRVQAAEHLSLVRGKAAFLDPHAVLVSRPDGEGVRLAASKIFINTGTRPAVPPVVGDSPVEYLDNESIMELDAVPGHLIVLGGGYIGVEFAQMFRRFGSAVTLLQSREKLLAREDDDVSDAVAELLRGEGIELLTGARLLSVERENSSGGRPIRCRVLLGSEERVVSGSHLLVATGRQPNTDGIGLDRAGVSTDERGYITVNDRLESGVEGIWALGDVKGGPAFTHISYDDFRILSRNLLEGGNASIKGRLVPYTVFTDPQLGRVGMTEREARQQGENVRVAQMPMSWVARALETDETAGFMKAVVDGESGQILGFAMLGIDAGEIAGAVQIAMMAGLGYPVLRDAVFSHPTTMEALNNLFSNFR